MRFLLFNLAVGAAIFYLLTGDPGATARQAGLPESAVTAIDTLGDKARQAVVQTVAEAVTPEAEAPVPEAQPAAAPKAEAAPAKPKAAQSPPPVTAAATPPSTAPAEFVPTRPVHAAPAPKANPAAEAPSGPLADASPALAQRRAEVLGNKAPAGKFEIKSGERLMSARDRYLELNKLVDDMELVYFNSLGN